MRMTIGCRLLRGVAPLLGMLAFGAGAAWAEPPRVAVSIKPIHSLVASVMDGVGKPTLIVDGGGSPHSHSLRPSQARALEAADLVFWVGPEVETFLDGTLETLAPTARHVRLTAVPGLTVHAMRAGGAFAGGHDHGHAHGDAHEDDERHAHDAGHDDETMHVHEEEDEHEEAHAHDAAHDHDHNDTGLDAHIWLDPLNGRAIADVAAEALAEADPANAARYRENARALGEDLSAMTARLSDDLADVADTPFIVFHDAFQYFEKRFGLTAAGTLTVNPEVSPGAARLAEIRETVKTRHAACVFAEPQFAPRVIAVVTEATGASSGTLDPIGATLEPGPGLYPALIRGMAESFKSCLGAAG